MGAFTEVAKLTSKGQVTIPKTVRQTLGLDDGGKIAFEVSGSSVMITRVETSDLSSNDPALGAFLMLLEKGIRDGQHVVNPSSDLILRMEAAAHSAKEGDDAIEGRVEI